jgi:CRISPR/Cas system-associated exonuclease Cas4 (RecB family)
MAKDIYHKVVKEALIKDGWTVTHDPYPVFYKEEKIDYEIDLGAEKVIIAERGIEKIAVEVKTFAKPSIINEFHTVLGQYLTYLSALRRFEPDRKLFLAIPLYAEERLEDYPFIQSLIEEYHLNLIIFDWTTEKIISWKS